LANLGLHLIVFKVLPSLISKAVYGIPLSMVSGHIDAVILSMGVSIAAVVVDNSFPLQGHACLEDLISRSFTICMAQRYAFILYAYRYCMQICYPRCHRYRSQRQVPGPQRMIRPLVCRGITPRTTGPLKWQTTRTCVHPALRIFP